MSCNNCGGDPFGRGCSDDKCICILKITDNGDCTGTICTEGGNIKFQMPPVSPVNGPLNAGDSLQEMLNITSECLLDLKEAEDVDTIGVFADGEVTGNGIDVPWEIIQKPVSTDETITGNGVDVPLSVVPQNADQVPYPAPVTGPVAGTDNVDDALDALNTCAQDNKDRLDILESLVDNTLDTFYVGTTNDDPSDGVKTLNFEVRDQDGVVTRTYSIDIPDSTELPDATLATVYNSTTNADPTDGIVTLNFDQVDELGNIVSTFTVDVPDSTELPDVDTDTQLVYTSTTNADPADGFVELNFNVLDIDGNVIGTQVIPVPDSTELADLDTRLTYNNTTDADPADGIKTINFNVIDQDGNVVGTESFDVPDSTELPDADTNVTAVTVNVVGSDIVVSVTEDGVTLTDQFPVADLISGDPFNTIQAGAGDSLLWSSSAGPFVDITDPTDTATWPALDTRYALQPVRCDGHLVGWLTRQGPVAHDRSFSDYARIPGALSTQYEWLPGTGTSNQFLTTSGIRSYTNTFKYPVLVEVDGEAISQLTTTFHETNFLAAGTVRMRINGTIVRGAIMRHNHSHNDLNRPGFAKADTQPSTPLYGSIVLQPGDTAEVDFTTDFSNFTDVESAFVRQSWQFFAKFKVTPAGK